MLVTVQRPPDLLDRPRRRRRPEGGTTIWSLPLVGTPVTRAVVRGLRRRQAGAGDDLEHVVIERQRIDIAGAGEDRSRS